MVMDQVKKRQTYAVQTGDFVGQMFVVCEVTDKGVGCLSVPEMKNVLVPTDKWSFGRNSDIIEYVEELSRDIFEVCVAQYSILFIEHGGLLKIKVSVKILKM
jgi:hypothetical protein